MTYSTGQPKTACVVKLSGEIARYTCRRAEASFVFSDTDRNAIGAIAVAAAVAGLSGAAASTAANAHATEETAHFVTFELDGNPLQGWVWRSPFAEGDIVDVAAEWQGDHYEIYGISRPSDRTIALYPHCSRAMGSHIRNALKWSAIWQLFVFLGLGAMGALAGEPSDIFTREFFWMSSGLFAFFCIMCVSLARKFAPFARLAEKVFIVLNLPNPTRIDLVKSSREQRTPTDPGEFGTFYFRY